MAPKRQTSVAIVYVTYDGAVNSTCGVGVLSQYFINSMPTVTKGLRGKVETTFHVVAVNLASNAHGYSDKILRNTQAVTRGMGGSLRFIDNGTHGQENYGLLGNWSKASSETAQCLQRLAVQYDHVLVYLVDTPFLQTPKYAKDSANITFVLVPHSDVYSHFPDNIPKERQKWEAEAFTEAVFNKHVYLASTSKFLANTLLAVYKVPERKIINLQTGISLTDSKFDTISEMTVAEKLIQYKIPLNKKLIFSVARAVPYKGFEALIEAFYLLRKRRDDIHLVFIASPFRNSSSNVQCLQEMIKQYDMEDACTPIYELDMELPKYICQWNNTKVVAQLSYREPFGLVPEEVRVWARDGGPIILASELDGFVEQISDTVDGYFVDPHDTRGVADKMNEILQLTDRQHADVREAGYRRCIRDYDYAKTVSQSVASMVDAL